MSNPACVLEAFIPTAHPCDDMRAICLCVQVKEMLDTSKAENTPLRSALERAGEDMKICFENSSLQLKA